MCHTVKIIALAGRLSALVFLGLLLIAPNPALAHAERQTLPGSERVAGGNSDRVYPGEGNAWVYTALEDRRQDARPIAQAKQNRAAEPQPEKSVNPGINKSFENPDVAKFVQEQAKKGDVGIAAVVNDWLRKDIQSKSQTDKLKVG